MYAARPADFGLVCQGFNSCPQALCDASGSLWVVLGNIVGYFLKIIDSYIEPFNPGQSLHQTWQRFYEPYHQKRICLDLLV
jgi:hypothetical protein